MRKIFYTLLAAISFNAAAMTPAQEFITIDYGKAVVHQQPGLDPCEWSYDGEQFTVTYHDQEFIVQPAFVDPALRDVTKEQLIDLLSYGYLHINQLDDGSFTLRFKMRLEGGAPTRKRAPMLVMAVFGVGCLAYMGIEYLMSDTAGNEFRPQAPQRHDNVHAKIIRDAAKAGPGLRSDGNRVNIATPACVVGGGLPRPIIGAGGHKGPDMRIFPMDKTSTSTRSPIPNFPLGPKIIV